MMENNNDGLFRVSILRETCTAIMQNVFDYNTRSYDDGCPFCTAKSPKNGHPGKISGQNSLETAKK
jgi:hypothetical protein